MPQSAERLAKLPPYIFAVQGQRIQEMLTRGQDVISLDIGSPDLPPPPAVIEALSASAHHPNNHGYAGYRGIPAFRQAVARYYQRRFGVTLDPEREVLPLIGSKEGIVNLCLGYLDRGDIALVPDVGYPSYSMGARLAGADVYWLPVNEKMGFRPNLEAIPSEIANQAKILWINYPNNPTGATAELEDYARLVNFCRENDILLASDNPYVDVTYDGYCAASVLQVSDAKSCAVEFMSFSKTYNMGGWRLGAAVGNPEALKILLQIKSNVDSGHFKAIYDAGVTALDNTPSSWIEERNHVYQRRRDQIMAVLPFIGLQAKKPKGSLYIWGRVESGNGTKYVDKALNEALIALAPGAAYGPGGEQYVRISLGIPDDRLEVALQRLKDWYAKTSLSVS
ncbi:MAG: aminotransferase class I/II-fold pyridoxal phosphate-dependent enzyme [Anaerolineae bacterium]|nr:aminotransferase class I/II-fold pyridoxal phosphate-dependent enzyme [Anaerolineae bacterium]